MTTIWLFILPAGLAACILALRRQMAASRDRVKPFNPPVTRLRAPTGKRPRRQFFASELVPGPDACARARRAAGSRLLIENTPPLPLPDCNTDVCHCRHRPWDDRRSGVDRRDRLLAYGEFDAEFNRNQRQDTDRRRRQV